ncbi:carbon monoxide dehydrogenase [Burkholderia cenocepacia]|uniref:FAD binding domain-containing protein n=1 Tax=Burkholderia anthinoferrum TaxID=3090833 RepID=UPI000CE20F80|nr:FAD binding domain-containing protein [Burkholderia anthinoferrum]RQU68176.1 carbon monoxide dehydrogenase [Burkholderia cenocepacia]RQZ85424.1 carbon monoxide dehydrogenase [Burkholderia cenocepacia]RRA05964.1 carbon monoxide dehydrogenase [Burkholderia cenocepacia]
MKPVAFEYHAPVSLQKACEVLDEDADAAKIMGGSQSMGPMLNMRLVRPAKVIDVSRLPELRCVSSDDASVHIGAAVTHAEIEDGVFPELRGGLMQTVAQDIAYRAVRTRGTIGGSLAHADPAADWVVVCTALGAQLTLVSSKGKRQVAMDDFMLGAYTTALREGEIVTTISVPRELASTRWAYRKFCRKTGEFAEASCAVWMDPERRFGRIVLGALDGAPCVLRELTTRFAAEGSDWLRSSSFKEALTTAVHNAARDRDGADHRLIATVVRQTLEQFCEVIPA